MENSCISCIWHLQDMEQSEQLMFQEKGIGIHAFTWGPIQSALKGVEHQGTTSQSTRVELDGIFTSFQVETVNGTS